MNFESANYQSRGPISLGEIADAIHVTIDDSQREIMISGVAALHSAGQGDITFFDNSKYLEQFSSCKAAACIVSESFADRAPKDVIPLVTGQPYKAYALVAQLFHPPLEEDANIHESAVIHETASIGENASIAANVVIGRGVVIGKNCRIAPNVTISSAKIGDNCILHPGVRIGQDGFGFAMAKDGHVKVPQLGGVVIGDDVEIGANTTVDRGSGPNTVIGDGTKIDNLVQIGHNVEIGKYCFIVSSVAIAGSAKLGDYVQVGGLAGIAGHLKIGSHVKIAGKSGLMKDVPAGKSVAGFPARDSREHWRYTATLERLVKQEINKERRKKDD